MNAAARDLMSVGNGQDPGQLSDEARGHLLAKLAARVERIDREQELILTAVRSNGAKLDAMSMAVDELRSAVLRIAAQVEAIKSHLDERGKPGPADNQG